MSHESGATVRWLLCVGCRVVGGILCVLVAIRGVYALWALDLRANTVLTLLYSLLPVANALAFICVRKGAVRFALQAVVTVGFIGAYAVLNWRTCSSLGYCTTVSATVWTTLRTSAVAQMCEGLMLSVMVAWLEGRPLVETERPA